MGLRDAQEYFTFDDFQLVPQHSTIQSRKEPNVSTQIGRSPYAIPVIAAPMNTVCEAAMLQAMMIAGGTGVLHRYFSIQDQLKQVELAFAAEVHPADYFVAVGATGDFLERAQALSGLGVKNFCVDVANGHSEICLRAVSALRETLGNAIDIMAGNVCSFNGTLNLRDAGANIIRVGIGCGSMCTTRLITGHGIPQLSALEDCARATGVTIVADGGIRTSGDMVKALAIGADAVMIGGLLAGTDQTPGTTHKDQETGQLFKHYHGMASVEGRQEWFSREATSFVPEGSSTRVPHKGDAIKVVEQLIGGIKVGMSFSNARTLEELQKNAIWARITENGRIEGTPNRKMFKR